MSQHEPWKQKVDLFRRRFGAREDVFGVKYFYTQTEYDADDVGKEDPRLVEKALWQPQCMNYGDQNICLIAKRQGGCATCEHKKYQPLTDEWLWKHISGDKELILYMLQKDGIKFGACDFDYGPHFEDAKAVRDISQMLGLPCYIARSSKKGYHLYWFFGSCVPAHLFSSLITAIYKKAGFLQRYQENPGYTLPETFPKQVNFNPSPTRPGNGIKAPMIEPRMREGFNCWVDDAAVPIPADQQWDYFTACVEITPAELEGVLEKNGIPIIHAPTGRSRRSVEHALNDDGSPASRDPIKPKGDFWRVVYGCPALKQFWEREEDGSFKFDKTANNNGVPHTARVASLAFAVATENGVDAIRARWGSARTEKEIEYALNTIQHPHTCRAMQENGICRIGMHPTKNDHCFKKIPPGEMRNGQYIVNPDNLPESEWRDQSPIRYATGFMTCDQIIAAFDELFSFRGKEVDVLDGRGQAVGKRPADGPADLNEQFEQLLRSARKLEPNELKRVQDHLTSKKYVKKGELKEANKSLDKEEREKESEKLKKGTTNFTFNGTTYVLNPPGYGKIIGEKNGIPNIANFTNFTVTIREELTLLQNSELEGGSEELTIERRWVKGVITDSDGKRHPFRANASEWLRGPDTFYPFLIGHAGTGLVYETHDFNAIRNCIGTFSKDTKIIRKKVEDFGHYRIKGESTYITPGVIVTKDQIRPNEGEFDLSFKDEASSHLGFKIIDEAQFKDLSLHILNDYFECNSSIVTMTAFAHAMAASVISHIPLMKSPVLWIDGSFGNGKTFVADMVQCFYGNFPSLTGTKSTSLGRLQTAHQFRDALLVIDDFKKSLHNEHGTKQMIEFIQSAYDRSGRQALKRDGELRDKATRIRGLICITGEEPPMEEASAISRMVIVTPRKDGINRERGERVKDRKIHYNGFTPYFIQYVYSIGEGAVKRIYTEYLNHFEQKEVEAGEEGMLRISENLAFNMTGFRLAMDLLHDRGVVTSERRDEFCARHVKNLEISRVEVIANTSSQRGVTSFLNTLKELLQDPARFHITNLPGYDPSEHKNSKPLGFYRESTPEVVYIYLATAHGEVEVLLNKSKGWSQSRHQIARQLVEDEHIPHGMWDSSSSQYAKHVKSPGENSGRVYVWAIKLSSLGLRDVPPPDNVVVAKIAAKG